MPRLEIQVERSFLGNREEVVQKRLKTERLRLHRVLVASRHACYALDTYSGKSGYYRWMYCTESQGLRDRPTGLARNFIGKS